MPLLNSSKLGSDSFSDLEKEHEFAFSSTRQLRYEFQFDSKNGTYQRKRRRPEPRR